MAQALLTHHPPHHSQVIVSREPVLLSKVLFPCNTNSDCERDDTEVLQRNEPVSIQRCV